MARGEGAARAPRPWLWAVLLVVSIQLLTIAGTWYVVDHHEVLYMARRVLHQRTFTLWRPGEPPAPFNRWDPEGPTRSRFLPTTALTVVPLLALDEALGWDDPRHFGRLVHLQGALFVLATLLVLARALRRAGASARAVAVAIVVTGLSGPLWLVSRRAGPEPILALLACAFVAAGVRRGAGANGGRGVQAAVCAALPWVHATGPVVSAALALSVMAEAFLDAPRGLGGRLRAAVARAWPVVLAGLAGIVSVVVLWNHLYHGSWWAAGYSHYAKDAFFELRNPLVGFLAFAGGLLLNAPLVFALAWLGVRRSPLRAPGFVPALCLTFTLLVFFSPFSAPEPARRLAATVPLWGLVVGATWDRLGWRPPVPQIVLAAALPAGFASLIAREGLAYLKPTGIHLPPHYLWFRLINEGAPWWQIVLPVGALCVLALLALSRSFRLLRSPAAASPSVAAVVD